MQKLQDEYVIHSEKLGTRVRIPWTTSWNEASAWAIEQYGLPGDKYHCRMSQDNMDFIFVDEQDAIIFNLRWL